DAASCENQPCARALLFLRAPLAAGNAALREDPLQRPKQPLFFRQYPFQLSTIEPDALTAGALVNLDALVVRLDQRRPTLGAAKLGDSHLLLSGFRCSRWLLLRERLLAPFELKSREIFFFLLAGFHGHDLSSSQMSKHALLGSTWRQPASRWRPSVHACATP